ncbi:MAG: Yip1 family protein [Hyphomonadaceae bacterium]
MTVDPANIGASNLIERAKSILITPQAEWDKIATEPADIGKIYVGYVLPLMVFSALCGFIGMSVFGVSGFGISYRVPLITGLVSAVSQVVLGVLMVYVMALIVNALAPNFGSRQEVGKAHQLAGYSITASALAGVFTLFPPLSMLAIVGLYSLALLFIGLPRLMNTPEDKRIGYFLTIIVVWIVLAIVVATVLGAVQRASGFAPGGGALFGQMRAAPAPSPGAQGSISINGQSVDLGQLEAAGAAIAAGATGAAGASAAQAVDPARLQAFLPQSLPGGFQQISSSASATGAMGVNASQAEAEYQNGDARMTVTVVHLGSMGGLTAMAGAMNVSESRQDADGYSRTNTVDGRVYSEEMSRSANTARFGIVGRGVAVTAEGAGITVDQARAAVETIGIARVEAAAN